MKCTLLLLLLTATFISNAQTHTLKPLWQTDSIVAIPESVLPDAKSGWLYVSLIDGNPWDADGKGGIARLKSDGTGYDSTWLAGLNAPKGLGLFGNRLYVADNSDVVVIDIAGKKIEKKIAIDSASGLNDITVSDKGVVYVSDSKTAKIWRIEKDKPTLFLSNMDGVNGLKAVKNDLIIASGKTFLKADAQKKLTTIAELPQGGDGIEPIGNGDYLVSAWSGYIFYVSAGGKVETILETHEQKKNTADIGYDPQKKIVYVPTFFAKTVTAYKLD
ncbi:MAG TPA: hypothetical protein VM010_08355 [Chitinophagaceae bacterium]|nr:hypothetical protein [Chitinophagaceae bacterium]